MKRFSRSDELVRHSRLHARAADSAAFAAAVAAASTGGSTVASHNNHTHQTSYGSLSSSSSSAPIPTPVTPPSNSSGSFATSYPRRMSLASHASMDMDQMSASLSSSAPAAPVAPISSSSFGLNGDWDSMAGSRHNSMQSAVPSHSLPALPTSLGGEGAYGTARKAVTPVAAYLPVEEIPINDLSISSSKSQQYQNYLPSHHQGQQHQQHQAGSYYPSMSYQTDHNHPTVSTSPATPSFLERSRSLSDPLPRIPENSQLSPISPLTATSAGSSEATTSVPTPTGEETSSTWAHLSAISRPRANSNVSLYSNASTACSGLSDDTVSAAVRGGSSEYQQGESDILKKHVRVHTTGSNALHILTPSGTLEPATTSDIFAAALVNANETSLEYKTYPSGTRSAFSPPPEPQYRTVMDGSRRGTNPLDLILSAVDVEQPYRQTGGAPSLISEGLKGHQGYNSK
ncbi:hypothetical protein HDU67_006900 [Dinochytrium kinnereticum]|nr:hypothetical protein HDU67_006900 [Dinochytrium kinnereticum]